MGWRPWAAVAGCAPSPLLLSTPCERVSTDSIHGPLLKKEDLELYHRMVQFDIAPQLYGLRWIRLLLGREFSLDETCVVWDALFADSSSLDLLDYVCVAMLCTIRDQSRRRCAGVLVMVRYWG